MGGLSTRFKWLRRRRKREPAAGEGVDRRTLLMGAAATAGGVAAGTSPAIASPGSAKTPALTAVALAPAQTPDPIPATQVSVVPTGEIKKTNAQAVFEDMDLRLSKVNLFEDLQVAMTLVDDFMGNTSTSGTIGQLGWALPTGATGTAVTAVGASEPGIFVVGTGTSASGWHGINLGSNNLVGSPLFMCEWRLKLTNLNSALEKYSCWFGLHNSTTAVEPTAGFYFRYTAADGPCWQAACADGGTPNAANTNVVANADFHRFRITCDGGGVARFYIDDNLAALIFGSLPSMTRYTPNLMIRKTTGTTARTVRVDYFAMRYEQPR